MLNDYKIQGKKAELRIEIEEELIGLLQKMEKHTKFTASEIINTAFKRFVAVHKDFLPPEKKV